MKKSLNFNWHVGIVLACLAVALSACTSDAEQYIQGKWGIGDVHYWAEWNFYRGTYSYENGYTQDPLYERGRYSVVESSADYIVLELFDREGIVPSIEDSVIMRIDIDRRGEMLHIRRGDFYRITDSSLESLATSRAP